jgi:SSS family solute:Na+ symporter
MMASGVSTISFMAIPAMVACKGLANSGSAIMILCFAPVAAYITYPLLRRLTITSTWEYVERRFGLPLRLIGSGTGLFASMMGRVGIVILLPALAISAVTNIDPLWACIALGVVTTIYSTFGGYEAVVWTDVVQGILMLLGFSMIGATAFLSIDGGAAALWQYGHELDRWRLFITKFDIATPMIWFAFAGQTLQMMSFAADQGTAQRILSTPMKDVRKLAYLGAVFGTVVAFMAAWVGTSLFGYFKSSPEMLNPIMKNDQMVPLFIIQRMPAGIAGLLIAVLFAASMSTVSTSINGASVCFAEDFVKRFKKDISSKAEMRVMQALSFVAGLIGTGMAIFLLSAKLPTLFEGFVKIMALIGGGFVGVYSLGMFTRRANLPGAVLGVVSSYVMAWSIKLFAVAIPIHWSAWGLFTTVSCIFFGYIFSLIIPYKNGDLTGLTVWDQLSDEEAEARLNIKE